MAKLSRVVGTTSQILEVFVQDSSATTGAGKTGIAYNASGLSCYYKRNSASASVAVTLASISSLGTFVSGGWKEVDSTNMPGVYEFHPPNAALASGADSVVFCIFGAANMAPVLIEVELTASNNQDGVHFGLTALPNAAAGANNGLPLSVDSSGRVDVLKINGTSQTARDIGASVLLSAGTGTGQLDFTSGVVKSNLTQILGTLLTETAGQIAGAFKKFFNVGSPTLTCLGIDQTGDSYARLGAPAGASVSADIAAAPGKVWDVTLSGHTTSGTTGAALDGASAPSAATVAAAVVDQTLSGHTTSGTVGGALNSASSAGDPWDTMLPGSYGSGTAGAILAGVKTKTDNLPTDPAHAQFVKNTGFNAFQFVLYSAANGTSPQAGLTVTAQRVIDAGALGSCTNSVVEIGSGIYRIDLSAADLNGNCITLLFSAPGALKRLFTIFTQS